MGGRTEMTLVEEGVAPQAVELFDIAVALGFGHGQKDQFDAYVQTRRTN